MSLFQLSILQLNELEFERLCEALGISPLLLKGLKPDSKVAEFQNAFRARKYSEADVTKAIDWVLDPANGDKPPSEFPDSPLDAKEPRGPETECGAVLFLASEPTDLARLRLAEEFRNIQERLRMAKVSFKLEPQLSARPADISLALLKTKPQIVHFSGHGTCRGALCFEDQQGKTQTVDPGALANLFREFTDQVKCVVLNACYSKHQASEIGKHIDFVIGMDRAIGDKAAIAFSVGFYQAIGEGCPIEKAYKLGCAQIGLHGFAGHTIPVLEGKH